MQALQTSINIHSFSAHQLHSNTPPRHQIQYYQKHANNNNNNLICIAPVCAKRLQWRWRTGLITEIKCLTENVCL